MKAAEVTLVKSVKSFVSVQFPGFNAFCFSFSEVSKKSNLEKSDFAVSFNVTETPEDFGEPGFTNRLKSALVKALDTAVDKIPYLSLSYSYNEDDNTGDGSFEVSMSFRIG